uniref:Uncharacterized protein n=1 Tax=Anguilla anguilla TaxID=7936 RepID=A0A0E9R7K4_ANGAN
MLDFVWSAAWLKRKVKGSHKV